MIKSGFACAIYASEIEKLRHDVYLALAELQDAAAMAGMLLPLSDGTVRASDQKPLTVALIGQYNAGKSTLIKALTGRSDIKIDSDICTDQIKAYDWHGIELIDTPGIHAGRSDHDSITYEAIDRADLLMFVITNELFNNCIGAHFRRLAFDRQKGQELMLVVNKMSQDPGEAAQKLKDITRVIEPSSAQDLYVTFTDAESYLDAQTADPDDRRELIELSGMESLVGNMNRFVTDRGLLARMTTPVFEIRRIADQIVNYFAVDQVEERMALELLYRKREILVRSRSRLEATLRSEMARTAVAVNVLGDRLAEAIRPGVSEPELNANAERVRQQVESAYRDTAGRIEGLVSKEVENLQTDIDALGISPLSLQLRALVRRGTSSASNSYERSAAPTAPDLGTGLADTAERLASLKRIGSTLDQIGRMAGKWATGPSAGAGMMSATNVAGSGAHTFVYNVGKFFGVKFAPWGAVHTAQIIGKIGVTLGAIGGIVGLISQIKEDIRNEEISHELRKARDSVRTTIREYVASMEKQFRTQFETLRADLYDIETDAVDESVKIIVGQRSSRSDTSLRFRGFVARASDLIARIHRDGEKQGVSV